MIRLPPMRLKRDAGFTPERAAAVAVVDELNREHRISSLEVHALLAGILDVRDVPLGTPEFESRLLFRSADAAAPHLSFETPTGPSPSPLPPHHPSEAPQARVLGQRSWGSQEIAACFKVDRSLMQQPQAATQEHPSEAQQSKSSSGGSL